MKRSRRRLVIASAASVAAVAVVATLVVTTSVNGPETRVVTDDTGTLAVAVPGGWDETRTSAIEVGGERRPYLLVAPDLDAYRERADAPGLEVLRIDGMGRDDAARLLDETAERLQTTRQCGDHARRDYARHGYEGLLEVYTGCGEREAGLWLLAAATPSDDAVLVVGIQSADDQERRRLLDSVTASS